MNLGLPRGAEMIDPAGLLESAGEHALHAKISAIEQAARPEVRALLQVAVEQLGRKS